ncbi:MAG TPA: hypothetical protein VE074_12645, partial [Jatrophihabitantaceae bacterium]|nr:hypothetical protein [Jatrophihabitantaceae bacterium]
PPRGLQLNKCWAIAHGGRLNLRNVTVVSRGGDGSSSSRLVTDLTMPVGDTGDANAWCANVVSDPLDQRDDCAADGTGASWGLRGVDVVVHNPDGSTSTRHGVDVQVRGGDAHAEIYCFNVTDGHGHVIQLNICNADARGGDVTLRDVTVHTAP